jgi:hypothetical protein
MNPSRHLLKQGTLDKKWARGVARPFGPRLAQLSEVQLRFLDSLRTRTWPRISRVDFGWTARGAGRFSRGHRDDQSCGARAPNGASVVGPGAATSLATLPDWWKHYSVAPDRKPCPVELAPGADPGGQADIRAAYGRRWTALLANVQNWPLATRFAPAEVSFPARESCRPDRFVAQQHSFLW